MRAFSIKFFDEVIKFFLLLKEIVSGRPCSTSLERQVHTLVPAVLLGVVCPFQLNLRLQIHC